MAVQQMLDYLAPAPDELSSMTREAFEVHHCFVDFRPDGHCCGVELYPEVSVKLDEHDRLSQMKP